MVDSIAPGASEGTDFDVSLFAEMTLTEKCSRAENVHLTGLSRVRALLGHSPHGCEAETRPLCNAMGRKLTSAHRRPSVWAVPVQSGFQSFHR